MINLSEHSLQGRIPPAHTGRVLHRPVPDPYGCGLEVYRQSRDAILQMIIRELCREEDPGLNGAGTVSASTPTSSRQEAKGMHGLRLDLQMFAAGCARRTTRTGKRGPGAPYMPDG